MFVRFFVSPAFLVFSATTALGLLLVAPLLDEAESELLGVITIESGGDCGVGAQTFVQPTGDAKLLVAVTARITDLSSAQYAISASLHEAETSRRQGYFDSIFSAGVGSCSYSYTDFSGDYRHEFKLEGVLISVDSAEERDLRFDKDYESLIQKGKAFRSGFYRTSDPTLQKMKIFAAKIDDLERMASAVVESEKNWVQCAKGIECISSPEYVVPLNGFTYKLVGFVVSVHCKYCRNPMSGNRSIGVVSEARFDRESPTMKRHAKAEQDEGQEIALIALGTKNSVLEGQQNGGFPADVDKAKPLDRIYVNSALAVTIGETIPEKREEAKLYTTKVVKDRFDWVDRNWRQYRDLRLMFGSILLGIAASILASSIISLSKPVVPPRPRLSSARAAWLRRNLAARNRSGKG